MVAARDLLNNSLSRNDLLQQNRYCVCVCGENPNYEFCLQKERRLPPSHKLIVIHLNGNRCFCFWCENQGGGGEWKTISHSWKGKRLASAYVHTTLEVLKEKHKESFATTTHCRLCQKKLETLQRNVYLLHVKIYKRKFRFPKRLPPTLKLKLIVYKEVLKEIAARTRKSIASVSPVAVCFGVPQELTLRPMLFWEG